MKSQQPENLVKTSCKDCAFAIYEENTQTGCAFDRIEKFSKNIIEAYDNEKEFYVIDRLCTYFRDKKWGYSLEDKDKVKEESSISFDIIFDCNEIGDDYFETIKRFLVDTSYKKYRVFLAHEYDKSIDDKIIDLSKFFNPNTTVSCCYKIGEFVHEQVMKNKTTFHAFINRGNIDFCASYLLKINDEINEKLNKFVVAKINDVIFVNNFVYKSFQYIKPCYDYSEHVRYIIESIQNTNMYQEITNDN
jgi:hypothetical protein